MANSGNPLASQRVVNFNERTFNYVWNPAAGTWVPEGTSGSVTVIADVSGEVVRVTNLSGGDLSVGVSTSGQEETYTSNNGAIDVTFSPGYQFYLQNFGITFSAPVATSSEARLYLDAVQGATYDNVVVSFNPSDQSAQYVFVESNPQILFLSGDAIRLTYANPDTLTYGVRITITV